MSPINARSLCPLTVIMDFVNEGWQDDPDNPVHVLFKPSHYMTLSAAKQSLQHAWQSVHDANDKQVNGQFYIACTIPPPQCFQSMK